MRKLYVILIICVLLIGLTGCDTKPEPPKERTLGDVILAFHTLVWEMYEKGGVSEKRVKYLLDSELAQDPDFIAVFHAFTGIEDVNLAISWKRDSQDLFANASLIIKSGELDAPLPVDRLDIVPYVFELEPGLTLDYFVTKFGRPGVITDYIFGNFKYRWFTSEFVVVVEVDGDLNVLKLEMERVEEE